MILRPKNRKLTGSGVRKGGINTDHTLQVATSVDQRPIFRFSYVKSESSVINFKAMIFQDALTQNMVKIKVQQSLYRPITGSVGYRRLRFPYFMTAHEGGKWSALCTGRFHPPGNIPGILFC